MAFSWFRRVFETIAGKQTEDFILAPLDPPNAPQRPVVKDEEYVTITVKSWRVVDIRKWTSKFYGCIQSRAHYLHLDKGLVEYQTVIVPAMLRDLDPKNVDRVIAIDKKVLGPVPYLGGLSLELGLFSIKGSDLAGPYIDLLTNLATESGVAFFAQAVPFVEPLRKGAELLFGDEDQAQLEIGLDETWETLKTGMWLLMRAPKGKVNVVNLRLDPQDFRLIDDKGLPFGTFPYVVFSIDAIDRRDDWMLIPELKKAWDAIGEAAKKRELDLAENLLTQFAIVAGWSTDFVPKDAKFLEEKARSRLPLLQKKPGVAATTVEEHPLGSFESLDLYGSAKT